MALRNHRLAALAFFALMSVLHSWPLASDPAHLARLDNHDAELNTWIVAWVPHAVATNPLGLFDAPIFYPERNALAFSEHMFVPAMIGAPLIWAGASPVLVYNLLILLGFALSGFAMYWVIREWTGSTWAALAAGLAYAFNAHVLTRFAHLQAQHVEFFPIVLYAFDRVLTRCPSTSLRASQIRDAVLLAAAFVLQALCSNHLLVFTAYALVASAVVRWREILPAARVLAGAAVISVAVLSPFLWPYYQVDREYGLARSADIVTQYNAGWRDYLVTGGRLHYRWWSHRFYDGRTALFPGITVVILAGIGVLAGRRNASSKGPGPRPSTRSGLRDPRVRMAVAIAIVGAAFSFGTALPGYESLHGMLPLLSGIRSVARWGWLVLAAAAMLAGFGLAALETQQRLAWRGAATLLCLLVTVEAIRTPVGYTRFNGIPRIYDRFAGQPAVLAEFPFYSGASVSDNGRYVLANTRYFKPLLNGYSGFHPEPFMRRGRALNSFPSEQALAELTVAGVTDVLVHVDAFRDRYGEAALAAIDTVAALEFVGQEDGIRLYRLR